VPHCLHVPGAARSFQRAVYQEAQKLVPKQRSRFPWSRKKRQASEVMPENASPSPTTARPWGGSGGRGRCKLTLVLRARGNESSKKPPELWVLPSCLTHFPAHEAQESACNAPAPQNLPKRSAAFPNRCLALLPAPWEPRALLGDHDIRFGNAALLLGRFPAHEAQESACNAPAPQNLPKRSAAFPNRISWSPSSGSMGTASVAWGPRYPVRERCASLGEVLGGGGVAS
jgi:hypothetical protein